MLDENYKSGLASLIIGILILSVVVLGIVYPFLNPNTPDIMSANPEPVYFTDFEIWFPLLFTIIVIILVVLSYKLLPSDP